MPVGNAVTKSVSRTPRGESYMRPASAGLQHARISKPTSRHSPGQSPTLAMFPTHRPPIQPTPVATLAFSFRLQLAISLRAFACALAHACAKSGISVDPTGGGLDGPVAGNVPGTAGAEGTGKGVKGRRRWAT
ncbi:hypothetical protein A0H81_05142 [Grifola frondosa]|uniref:Uncharacterized protein n=1 Tax=Grifola frondosa TaxID=5627 RepID=A0A1C7MD64_GRIFR|nr:hypothetical protein A0H81_05142 [Grifola frondosa]